MNEKKLDKIPHNCVLQLKAILDNLKSAERKAADFLLENPTLIPGISIVEYASQAGCSEATIVRLAKKLGYEGFPELKRDFNRYQAGEQVHEYENISKSDEPLEVMRKVFESTIQGIEDTQKMLDEHDYMQVLDALVGAEKVMFCGVGDAGAVAMEAQQKFVRLGLQVLFSSDPDLQLIMANQLQPGDVCMIISHSGRSKTILDALKTAKESGATTVLISNFPVSPMARFADYLLQTAVFNTSITGEVMAKRITALSLIESLYINYLMIKGTERQQRLKSSDTVVGLNKI